MALEDYNWPGPFTPFDHQMVTTQFAVDNPRCFILNDMGTGKTASLLWAMDYLQRTGQVRKALVVAPLSTLERVWRDEAFKLVTHRRAHVLWHRTGAQRKELYDQRWDIGITNFDGIKVLEEQIRNDDELDMIVVDEAATFRNSQNVSWKRFKALTQRTPRLVMMTGTPTPNAPTDAWGLAKMLGVNPDTPRWFGSFRRETMRQVSEHKWIPQPDGYDKAFKLLQPAIRYDKDDCLDLPPVTYQQWEVDLSPQQRKAYKTMQKQMKIEWANHGDALVAANAADRINKMRQIACGVIKDTKTGEYIGLPTKPRVDAVLEAIELANAKVIVVVPFKGAIQYIAKEVGKHHKCAISNGDVSNARRNEIYRAFDDDPDLRVLLVHPKVMAHGLTMTVADTMVFYAPVRSNEQTQQVVERINRPGQTRSMTVIQLGATPLEWGCYDEEETRATAQGYLLNLYRKALDPV